MRKTLLAFALTMSAIAASAQGGSCADATPLDTAQQLQVQLRKADPPPLNCEAYPLGPGREHWIAVTLPTGSWRLKVFPSAAIGAVLMTACDSACWAVTIPATGGTLDWKFYAPATCYVMLSAPVTAVAKVEVGRYEAGQPCWPWYAGGGCPWD